MYFTARRDSYRTRDGKIVDPYFVVELPTSVVAMAITAENEVIMINQYRHPLGENLLELPGGFIDEGEIPHQAVERELLEETGYSFDHVHYLGMTAANPGVLNNVTHMFVATGGKKTADQKLDANEEIEVVFLTIDELKQLVRENKIVQSMHISCILYALERLNELKY